ncbi:G patch domain-containing protein 1 [Trichoderma lentiforme]|uniref:G patch domain-containing protein 1 n=1 Tax=Trichoderma lentiforme TaxID=1567552 RepID=A0A9P4X3B1_9HYPO|nr:G patch domain-containing protein 1 [Trichoderma lentiforme]
MSYKRSRATFEADLHAPYAIFGTPLPEDGERDDGSYLPLWKQEVRDDKGRRRLHGAFTGGWSAGYFNTVGSKEGWTPSTFVSSRSNRRKDEAGNSQQRAEDYMDEEDLADAAEAQTLKTTQAFAGLGSSTQEELRAGGLMGLFRADGDTMGLKLLRRMGWKDGQGIGPKVRRGARLDLGGKSNTIDGETHLFAPDNTEVLRFVRKTDRMGLGHNGQGKLFSLRRESKADSDEEVDSRDGALSILSRPETKKKPQRGGIGVGILNDDGSDDEDPYEIGPKIKYNRVVGGDKKKKGKKLSATANPSLKNAPVFIPKTSRVGGNLRRCQDGRLPLDGFVLANAMQDLTITLAKYAPPPVPPGWMSSKVTNVEDRATTFVSAAEAAKSSTLDAKSRAAILGEAALPGKSVFDYISAASREKLAAASGRVDLPPGLGEIPAEFAMSEEEKQTMLWEQVPKLDHETAIAAIARGLRGPYADDETKRARYKRYLEHHTNPKLSLPDKPRGMSDDEFLREMTEFHNCARIFKPMTGFMASRFTTAKTPHSVSAEPTRERGLISVPEPKISDPAEEAAKMGMFGKMTRSVEDFYPTRLLCKRFNVKPPSHARRDDEPEASKATPGPSARPTYGSPMEDVQMPLLSASRTRDESPVGVDTTAAIATGATTQSGKQSPVMENQVNPDRNEAVEGKTANADVLRAIFGDKQSATLSETEESGTGPSESSELIEAKVHHEHAATATAARQQLDLDLDRDAAENESAAHEAEQSPPPQYPISEASSSRPPPFSSLFSSVQDHHPSGEAFGKFPAVVPEGSASASVAAPAYGYDSRAPEPFHPDQAAARAFQDPVAETKRALPRDTKGESSRKDDDAEPPPAYSEGDSPLHAFSYVMAAAGGASSIITQVQQGGPPINAIGDVGADETITMDLRGTRFVLSRDELLTLPEFVLLSLFPNGLFPEGHMSGFPDSDAVQVDYDPASLQYMLDFFRTVAQSIPTESSPGTSQDGEIVPLDPMGSREDASKRAGIIVLREDLDFYAIPPKSDISQPDMIEVKRAAARALLKQDGIFSGLKRSDEPGTTEAHLIEMLTAGGFNHDDCWGHRAGEPNKAVICSLALARLRSDIRGNEMGNNAVGMAQKLLLFWRKPARRCWWEGIELDNVEGVEGKLKVWIRRVWTLEMSVIGLR